MGNCGRKARLRGAARTAAPVRRQSWCCYRDLTLLPLAALFLGSLFGLGFRFGFGFCFRFLFWGSLSPLLRSLGLRSRCSLVRRRGHRSLIVFFDNDLLNFYRTFMGLFAPFLAFLFFIAGQFVIFLVMQFALKHATLPESPVTGPIISPSPLINAESELCQAARA